jgi:cytochrome c peroxidase
MRLKYFIFIIIVFVFSSQFFITCSSKNSNANNEAAVKKYFYAHTDSLLNKLAILEKSIVQKVPTEKLRAQFSTCRNMYKRIECIVEYSYQGLSKRINGAALPDIKTEDGQVFPPHGLQVIEQFLYSNYNDTLAKTLVNEINVLKTDLFFVKKDMESVSILPHHIFELLQHQFIRMAAQGLSGFDTPLSKLSLSEIVYSLDGIENIYTAYYGSKAWDNKTANLFISAKKYLKDNNEFDAFDRMYFLTTYLMPASTALANAYTMTGTDSLLSKPFKGTLTQLLKGQNFNADYYASYAIATSNTDKIILGKKLFYNNTLSKNNSISCASCHKPDLYFTDGKEKANNFIHGGSLQRNTPTLLYAAMQSHQFFDVRSTTLEDQINEVFKNTNEFNFNANSIAKKLVKDTGYYSLFKKAFNRNDSIGGYEVRNAISSYIRSLSPFNSRFDEYLSGNANSMNKEEVHGFNLFMGKGKCGSCHFIPLFNGNIPPWFTKSESEIIGVPKTAQWTNATIDADEGRYNINKMEELKYAFKTPTIRNIEKTAPYMHNGVYKNVEDIVTFYNKGGGVGLGIALPFQTLPFDSLSLNKNEQKAVVAFMKTLTDKIDGK